MRMMKKFVSWQFRISIVLFALLIIVPVSESMGADRKKTAMKKNTVKKTAKKVVPQTAGENDVMNFDATVIEGERKNPSIFLDITIDRFSDLDSILLIRKHFNNFHIVDADKRTMYIY